MKTLTLLAFIVLSGTALSAQDQSPIPKISQQISSYFSYHPREKVFIMTDKGHYKPGETIWFSAFVTNANNQILPIENRELYVKLYDKKGTPVLQDIFRLNTGSTPGDLFLPEDLPEDTYFLAAYTSAHISPEEISCTPLKIDPTYSNQYVAETSAKDSIFLSGQKNEIRVILHDISGEIQKNTRLRYQLTNGTEIVEKGKLKTDANGRITIPITIPNKTNGEPFICELTDTREEWKHEVFLPTDLDPVIIKFYPEGGNLTTGIPTKIGFTAFNKWGLPVEIEGSILNQEGKPITTVKTFTKGLGLFAVTNDEQQKYKLVLSGKTGQNQSFELPAPNLNGLALSLVKTDSEYLLTNLIFADKQKHAIALTVTQGSNLYWAGDMEIDAVGRIKIPSENLPQGINLLSVFTKEGNLLAERIIYHDKNQKLKIEIVPGKTSLQPDESMNVKVRLTDEDNLPVSGNIVVAVTDKFRKGTDRQEIDEYLLIGSELETPFSLISGALKGKISNSALMDVFLIANRVKGFDWGKIRRFNPDAPDFNAGNNRISGFVTDKNENKINKAKVSLVNNKTMQLHTTTTNAEGFFSFPNLNTINAEDFTAKATDSEGKHELKVVLSKNFEGQISVFITENVKKYTLLNIDQVADENYFRNNGELFPRAPKLIKNNTIAIDNQRKMLSTSTNIMDVIKTIKPYKIMSNQIVFYGSENSLNYQGGALLVLDGQQLGTDISSIQSLSPTEIDHINISTNPMDIQRYTGLNSVGVIEIFLKSAKLNEPIVKNETHTSQYDGIYRIPNVFPTEPVKQKRDTRTTLLWIPEQKVDESGLFEFNITAGKVLSDFEIEVQGLSGNDRIGKGKVSFKVMR
ncbi:MAG TPA: MG2 domain-containing protein [Prolixibacteraceae bacterium]|nr:MG2 domain-containing protein [Prolixibacteraceae bacterium]